MLENLAPFQAYLYYTLVTILLPIITLMVVKWFGEKNMVSTLLILLSYVLVSFFPIFVFDLIVDLWRYLFPVKWLSIPLGLLTLFGIYVLVYLQATEQIISFPKKRKEKKQETPAD